MTKTFKRSPAAHECPYCLKPVGWFGRFLKWAFGLTLHRCDNSNVAAPGENGVAKNGDKYPDFTQEDFNDFAINELIKVDGFDLPSPYPVSGQNDKLIALFRQIEEKREAVKTMEPRQLREGFEFWLAYFEKKAIEAMDQTSAEERDRLTAAYEKELRSRAERREALHQAIKEREPNGNLGSDRPAP